MTEAANRTAPARRRPAGARSPAVSLALHATLFVVSVVMLYPLLWMLSASFRPAGEIFGSTSLWPGEFDPGAYIRGWFALRVPFGQFMWNSFVIATICVLGNVFACSLVAYAFARLRFRGRNLWFALMLGTLMIPYHVVLVPQYVLFRNLDWIDTILPLVVPKLLATDAFFIFLMVQFFRGIPRELDEAAMIDGCGRWGIYWRIMLPLSRPVLATAAIFTFLWTWEDFFGPLVYLSDVRNYTAQLALRAFVDSTGQSDWGGLFAMSTLSLVPVFLIFLFFQRFLVEGIATTGLKR